jgi:hypothetical protein
MPDRTVVPGLPSIRRARGYRLYDRAGRRYLDLFQDGGGAILGHRGASVLTGMKNALAQGLAAGLPSVWESRLESAINRMFPAYRSVRLYSSRKRAIEAASRFLGRRLDPTDVADPALDPPADPSAGAAVWRPFLPKAPETEGSAGPRAAVLLPVLPFSISGSPAPACFLEAAPEGVPDSDLIPGFILAGAVRALAALDRQKDRDAFASIGIDGTRGWKRAGPYVRPTFDEAEYPRVFAEYLRAGVLLSPEYPGPSVLPGECSPGEKKLLARLFASIPGG